MIICIYNGEIHCISEAENFRKIVAPEVFDALHEFLKIQEPAAEKYEDLEREYDRLYDELEDTKSEVDRLEEENDSLSGKLSNISKKIEELLNDKDFGYIDQEEFNNKIIE